MLLQKEGLYYYLHWVWALAGKDFLRPLPGNGILVIGRQQAMIPHGRETSDRCVGRQRLGMLPYLIAPLRSQCELCPTHTV